MKKRIAINALLMVGLSIVAAVYLGVPGLIFAGFGITLSVVMVLPLEPTTKRILLIVVACLMAVSAIPYFIRSIGVTLLLVGAIVGFAVVGVKGTEYGWVFFGIIGGASLMGAMVSYATGQMLVSYVLFPYSILSIGTAVYHRNSKIRQ